jgi:hypothetical protein
MLGFLLRVLRYLRCILSTQGGDWTPQERIDLIRNEAKRETREVLLKFREADKTSAALEGCLAQLARIREREAEAIREQQIRQASEKRIELIGWSVILLILLLLGYGLYAIVFKHLLREILTMA